MHRVKPGVSLRKIAILGGVIAAALVVFMLISSTHGTPTTQASQFSTPTATAGPSPTPKANDGLGNLSGLFDACAAIGAVAPAGSCVLQPVPPATTIYGCMTRTDENSTGTTDHYGNVGTLGVKTALLCYSTAAIGLGGGEPPCESTHGFTGIVPTPGPTATPAPSVDGEGTCNSGPGHTAHVGQPPYAGGATYKLQGFYCNIPAGCTTPLGTTPNDSVFVLGCLPNFGTSLGPNAIVVNQTLNAKASNGGVGTNSTSQASAFFNASVAQCAQAENGNFPAGLGASLSLATKLTRRDTTRDTDGDGCTDMVELWQDKAGSAAKCGRNPFNPYDPTGTSPDISGTWSLLAQAVRSDRSGANNVPGFYYNCHADLQETNISTTQDVTARLICYIDGGNPVGPVLITVNPQVAGGANCPPLDAKFCGDGQPGSPPPGCSLPSGCVAVAGQGASGCGATLPCDTSQYQFADIDNKEAVLTGVVKKPDNTLNLHGCYKDVDGNLQNVAIQADVNIHTGEGWARIVPFTPSGTGATTCEGVDGVYGTTDDAAGVSYTGAVYVGIAMDRQAPGPKTGATTTFPYGCVANAGPGYSNCRDSDGDGCPDKIELSDAQGQGGLRDPLNRWDYFNAEKVGSPHNQGAADISKVVKHYGKSQGNQYYSIDTDRTALTGGNVWNLGPPDGQQTTADILAAIKQYNQNC